MRPRSLRRLIIAGVLLADLLCVASFSIVATVHEMHGRRRGFDGLLRGRAEAVLGATRGLNPAAPNPPSVNLSTALSELALPAEDSCELLDASGRIADHSRQSPAGLLAALKSSARPGYFDFTWNSENYRAIRIEAAPAAGSVTVSTRDADVLLYAAPTTDLAHELIEAIHFYTLATVLFLAAMALLLVLFLHRSLAPLRQLAASAARVSTTSWGFDPPPSALRTREFQPIIASIRKLLHGLQLSFERQRQFTGDAAHELKTSLALLKSSVQLLSMRQRTTAEYETGLAELDVDIRRMEDLTEQMLTAARLEEEPPQSNDVVDLAAIVRSTSTRLRPLAEAAGITLRVDAESAHSVRLSAADADILTLNLVRNALQHSPAQSTVTVSLQRLEHHCILRVADRGEGIASTALPHVFERFYRADTSRSRLSGGAGLGLAICKSIVERSHGSIVIESDPGKGTQVIVRLASAG
jgi:signal transduction histidine kinase